MLINSSFKKEMRNKYTNINIEKIKFHNFKASFGIVINFELISSNFIANSVNLVHKNISF